MSAENLKTNQPNTMKLQAEKSLPFYISCQPPAGFEFFGKGPVKGFDMHNVAHHDIFRFCIDWIPACGNSTSDDYALRIGSEIHAANFGPPQAEYTEQAREWWLNVYPEGSCANAHPTMDEANEKAAPARVECIKVREVLASEPARYTVAQIADYFSTCGFAATDAIRYLDHEISGIAAVTARKSQPFDWGKLWGQVPEWHNWIAANEVWNWYSYKSEPKLGTACFSSQDTYELGAVIIPPAYAPPRAGKWQESLTERPKA